MDLMHFEVIKPKQIKERSLKQICGNTIYRLCNLTYEQVKIFARGLPIVVFIRDPRTLITSCTDYHLRGSEKWALKPQEKFNNLSYTELLQQGRTDEERLIISMENLAGDILKRIETFVNKEDVLLISLESLAWDSSLSTFKKIADYCHFEEPFRRQFIKELENNSLRKIKENTGSLTTHSTSGVSKSSIKRLTGRAEEVYTEHFGDLHTKLGYDE